MLSNLNYTNSVSYEKWLEEPSEYDYLILDKEIAKKLTIDVAYTKAIMDWKKIHIK